MMWTHAMDQQFPNDRIGLSWTFFYPASGRDLNPLVRFSHLIRDYVYVDYHGEKCFEFREGYEPLPGLVVLEVGPKNDLPVDRESLSMLPMGIRRRVQAGTPMWYRVVLFARTVGHETRVLRLFCVNGEAHYTYASLYGKNHVAPMFLCTILDGTTTHGWGFAELGLADGSFMSLVNQGPKPQFWVRDVAPNKRHQNMESLGWDQCVQGYTGWRSPTSRAYSPVLCSGTKFGLNHVSKTLIFAQNGNTMVIKETGDVMTQLEGCDAVFLPLRFIGDIPRLQHNPGVWLCDHAIERNSPHDAHPLWRLTPFSVPGGASWEYQDRDAVFFSSLRDFLAAVSDICAQHNFQHIAMMPFGLEDEGATLIRWWRESHVPRRVTVLIKYPLDLMDLRTDRHEWSGSEKESLLGGQGHVTFNYGQEVPC